VHRTPLGWHAREQVPSQIPEQHAELSAHAKPSGWQAGAWQTPFVQLKPPQHTLFGPHSAPVWPHAVFEQTPFEQIPEQHAVLSTHAEPLGWQLGAWQTPFKQLEPVQHTPVGSQGSPVWRHVVLEQSPPAHKPEQQSAEVVQTAPPG
jgi:hypothetical protein